MAHLSLRNLSKTYPNGVAAVRDFSFEVADGDFVVIVGPSGCGKSTVLRLIAGLETCDGGDILVDGNSILQKTPQQRNVAMVFQDYALYGAMTVRQNIAVGLEKRFSEAEIDEKVRAVAEMLEIGDLLERRPRTLSGGQQQRVSLARALVRDPAVFLLDEPLSGLDARQRDEMRTELLRIHRNSGATFLYVTHDQVEAMTLGSQLIVMRGGAPQQTGTPEALYRRPENLFVAGFLGSPPMNFLRGTVAVSGSERTLTGAGFALPLGGAAVNDGQAVVAGVRPEDIHIARDGGLLAAVIESVELLGSERIVALRCGDSLMRVRADADADYTVGETVFADPDFGRLHLFDEHSEQRI